MNDAIEEYYQKIKNKSVIVGQWIEHLFEMIIQKRQSGEYKYDHKAATDAVEWIEKHAFHTKGFLAPNNLKLELWQRAFVSCLFGLLDPKTGKRQFREAVLIVGRKNGKSLLAAAIAKYVLYIDGGYGSRVFCTAPKLDQADLIYDDTWKMIELDPEWIAEEEAIQNSIKGHNKKTVDDSGHAKRTIKGIAINKTNALMKKQAFSIRKSDGFDPSLVICDEIASWQGDAGLKQYEVWKSAGGAREMGQKPMIVLSCSTAGYVNDSIYDELTKRSTRFLMGESKEKRLLPFLYIIDDPDKWNDINELHKSLPNLGVSVSIDYVLEEIAIAEGSLSKKAEFLTKYCNVKQNSSVAWLNTQDIEKNFSGKLLDLNDFRDCYAVGGIDLSQTTDLTAAVLIIEKDGKQNVFAHFWMPAERIDEASERDGVPYRAYLKHGQLSLSGEGFVQYQDVEKWFTDLVEEYRIYPLKIGFDRYSAQYLVQDLSAYGFNMDDVYQGENLTPVINEVDGMMREGRFDFGNNDLLKMHLRSSALKCNNETNRKRLVKISQTQRIDGVAAFLDAMCVRQKWFAEIGEQLKNGD